MDMAQIPVKQEPEPAKSLPLGEIGTGASSVTSPADLAKVDKPTESSRKATSPTATSPDKASAATVEEKSGEDARDKETRPKQCGTYIEIIGEHLEGDILYYFARVGLALAHKIPASICRTKFSEAVDEYERLKALGQLKPFDPSADCIDPQSRTVKRASPEKNPPSVAVATHDDQTPPNAITEAEGQKAPSKSPLPSQAPNLTHPRPFPTISPPQTPMVIHDAHETIPDPDPESDGEMLPTIEKMLADTRPDYTGSQVPPATPRPATKVEAHSPTNAVSFSQPPRPRPKAKSKSTVPSRPRGTGVPPSPSAAVIEILSSPGSPTPGQTGSKRKHDDIECPVTPKRARRLTGTGTGKGKRRFTKHETHWYLDGSVLVQIKSVQFKLHRSRLNKLSRWFEEQFERDANDEEDDGDLPIYYLDETGITVRDFEVLLDAMDDAITYFSQFPPFRIIASILRASTALDCPTYHSWAVQYLEDLWSPDISKVTPVRINHATECVVLARKYDMPRILKRALYELVRTQDFGQSDDMDETHQLPFEDYKLLVSAREKLSSHWIETAASPSTLFQCPRPTQIVQVGLLYPGGYQAALPACTSATILPYFKLVNSAGMVDEYKHDPICGYDALINAPWKEEGYCEDCVRMRKEAWTRGKEKLWGLLNIWFGLVREE